MAVNCPSQSTRLVSKHRLLVGQSGCYLQSEYSGLNLPMICFHITDPYQIDFFTLCWAVHRLNGICLPVHPTSSPDEITSHLTNAKCGVIFTCQSLIESCLTVAKEVAIPPTRIFTLPLPEKYINHNWGLVDPSQSLEQLIAEGSKLEPLSPLEWAKGQGRSQVAFLCSTSGTSGKQVCRWRLTVNHMPADDLGMW